MRTGKLYVYAICVAAMASILLTACNDDALAGSSSTGGTGGDVASASSVSASSTGGSASCRGCVDADGNCRDGIYQEACGQDGEACFYCPSVDTGCTEFACIEHECLVVPKMPAAACEGSGSGICDGKGTCDAPACADDDDCPAAWCQVAECKAGTCAYKRSDAQECPSVCAPVLEGKDAFACPPGQAWRCDDSEGPRLGNVQCSNPSANVWCCDL